MIVVCGEALIDSIRDPAGGRRDVPGGGPFNTARAAARLNAAVAFLGRLSSDPQGRRLRDELVADGVDVGLVCTGDEPTAMAIAELDAEGRADYRFELEGTAAAGLTAEMVPSPFTAEVAALHAGSLALALEPIGSTLEALAEREHGRRLLMLDPNVRAGVGDERRLRERLRSLAALATVVKASDSDLAFMEPRLDHAAAAHRLLERGARVVVVTLGERGSYALHGGVAAEVPAMPVDVVDTVGAGDVFGGALLAWLRDHERLTPDVSFSEGELREAVRYAGIAASLSCARHGAIGPTTHR